MSPARKRAYLAILISQLIWGGIQPIVKPALEFISPTQFLFLRYSLAAIIITPLLFKYLKKLHCTRKQLLRVIFIEGITVINVFLLFAALTYVTALQSSLIIQTRPIFVTIACLMFLNENIEKHEWIGLLFSVLGTFIILAKPFFFHADGFNSISFIGTSILVLSNFIYAYTILMVKKHYTKISKPVITAVHMWLGTTIFSLYLFITHDFPTLQTITTNASIGTAVLYAALFGSVIALTLSNYGIGKIEASEATLFHYVQPFIYIPLSVLWLNEPFESTQLLGITLIFLGVYYASSRPKKRRLKHGLPTLLKPALKQAPHPHMTRI